MKNCIYIYIILIYIYNYIYIYIILSGWIKIGKDMEGLDILYNKKLCYGHDHLNFQENILRDITPFGSHIKRKPGITPKSIKFLSRCKEMLKQSERGLIELLSEK